MRIVKKDDGLPYCGNPFSVEEKESKENPGEHESYDETRRKRA